MLCLPTLTPATASEDPKALRASLTFFWLRYPMSNRFTLYLVGTRPGRFWKLREVSLFPHTQPSLHFWVWESWKDSGITPSGEQSLTGFIFVKQHLVGPGSHLHPCWERALDPDSLSSLP